MTSPAHKPILFFDSGIGGLSVLREARILMPDRRFIYVADDAGFPYGRWEEAALKAHVVDLFDGLIAEHDPVLCVIACNTASTIVMDELRAAFPHMPFVGTVPAVKPAAERTATGLVSVLATPGTVKRQYTRDLIGNMPPSAMCASSAQKISPRWPKPICAKALSMKKPCAAKSPPASSKKTASAPTSSCSPARTIPSSSTACAKPRHGRWTGSTRPRRLQGGR